MECLLGMKGFIKGRLFSQFQRESIYLDSSKTRDTQMATRVTDGARRERHEKRETLFSSRAAALVSRFSQLPRSRARTLLSLLTCIKICSLVFIIFYKRKFLYGTRSSYVQVL